MNDKPTKTQLKQLKKWRDEEQEAIKRADKFVAQLARDIYVTRVKDGFSEAIAHECMDAAVAYFEALQTFRKPAEVPMPVSGIAEAVEKAAE